MSGTYKHTELTEEQKAAIHAFADKLERAAKTPEAEREEDRRALLADYMKKLESGILYGKDGKPKKPRFRWNPACFLREMEIRRQVDMIRRAEWARITKSGRKRRC